MAYRKKYLYFFKRTKAQNNRCDFLVFSFFFSFVWLGIYISTPFETKSEKTVYFLKICSLAEKFSLFLFRTICFFCLLCPVKNVLFVFFFEVLLDDEPRISFNKKNFLPSLFFLTKQNLTLKIINYNIRYSKPNIGKTNRERDQKEGNALLGFVLKTAKIQNIFNGLSISQTLYI